MWFKPVRREKDPSSSQTWPRIPAGKAEAREQTMGRPQLPAGAVGGEGTAARDVTPEPGLEDNAKFPYRRAREEQGSFLHVGMGFKVLLSSKCKANKH